MSGIKDRIIILKHGYSFVKQENIWKDLRQYGLISETAMFKKPLLIANPQEVYLYPYSRLQTHAKILNYTGKFIIKPYGVCSDNLLVVTGNHTPTVGIPQFFLGNSHINDKESDIIVGEGAWVGANVTLLAGATIGRGAVIGACSTVNKEIPPYAVAVGSPARIIASTFTKEQILAHERLVFKPEDRLSEEEINQLFENNFVGMKAIGTSEIKDSDQIEYSRIKALLETYPY